VILAVALIVVGPDKLPELARSLARGIIELKKTAETVKEGLMAENPLQDIKDDLKAGLPNLAELKPDLPDLQGAAKRFQEEILDIQAEKVVVPALEPPEKTEEIDVATAQEHVAAVSGDGRLDEPEVVAGAEVNTWANRQEIAEKDSRSDLPS